MLRVILVLKLKSSIEPFWGDSAVKCHRSLSLLLAMPIEGSVTLKFGAGAGGCACLAVVSGAVAEVDSPEVGLVPMS